LTKGRIAVGHGRYSYTLQWAVSSPLKIAPSHGGSGHPSNTWFLGRNKVYAPDVISIGSAVSCRAHDRRHTDRPNDRPRYSVYNNRPHLRT